MNLRYSRASDFCREDLLEKPFAGDGECMKDQYSGLPNRSNISRSYTEALAATAGNYVSKQLSMAIQ